MNETTTETQANPIDLNAITLFKGSHVENRGRQMSVNDKACAMEWVSVLAGETFSDHPECACPVIAAFVRTLNDRIKTDERRNELLRPILPLLLNTKATPDVERRRAYLAANWAAREVLPKVLRFYKHDALAEKAEAIPEFSTKEQACAARDVVREVAAEARKLREAAWSKFYEAKKKVPAAYADAYGYAYAADAAADAYGAYATDATDAYAAAAAADADAGAAYAAYAYAYAAYAYAYAAAAYDLKAKLEEIRTAAAQLRGELEVAAVDCIRRMAAVGAEAKAAE